MKYHISTTWTEHGTFFLFAEPIGREVSGFELASILFTWDAQSIYGTLIEPVSYHGETGIELTSTEALRFFSTNDLSNGSIDIEWDIDIHIVRQVAQLLRTAMAESAVLPDFEQWKIGNQAWKVNDVIVHQLNEIVQDVGPDVAEWLMPSHGTWFVNEWLNQAMTEAVHGNPEAAASLETTLQLYPRLTALPIHQFDNEQDWLEAVGFRENEIPFAVCLELCEPFDDVFDDAHPDEWTLRVLLRDKRAPEHVYPISGGTGQEEEPCPEAWTAHMEEVNRAVRIWQALCPWLTDEPGGAVDEPTFHEGIAGDLGTGLRTHFDGNGAWTFLTEVAPILVDAGYPVLAPSWWEEIGKRHAKVKARVSSPSGSAPKAMFGIQQIVKFDWRVSLGDVDISEADFETLLAQKQRLIRVQGRWIEIRPDFVEQFRKTTKAYRRKQGATFSDVLELVLLGEQGVDESQLTLDGTVAPTESPVRVDVELDKAMKSLFHALQNVTEMPLLDTPQGFMGQLRSYQRVGFSWLSFLRSYGLGACLADDMGLGKTVQYTAYLLQSRRAEQTPALLTCPTSVLGNWQKELERFAPELNVYLHYGANRKRGEEFVQAVAGADVVLTSYSLCHLDVETLSMIHWDSICLDEAQNIKNPHTKQAAAIRQLPAGHRIAMTGTPVENRLTELWSIFEFMNPGYLGSLKTFQERFQRPIERDRDVVRISQLKRLIGPFLLRRHKQDPAIELDLPEKMESKAFVPLTQEQAALYETVVQTMMKKLDTADAMERRGLILASLTKLKQVCNHPALFLKEEHEKRTITGRSAKVDRLVEMVSELRSEGDACLIFTQFIEAGRLIQQVLETELSETALFLHGGLNKAARDKMVSEFQSADGARIMILSLKAGGVGLNLTSANHVFHYDRWWNPAVENQATDRAYRIGQNRRVQVHKFVALGTLEERIDEMIDHKNAMSAQIVGTGEQWITELSTDELRELFRLRRDWGVDE